MIYSEISTIWKPTFDQRYLQVLVRELNLSEVFREVVQTQSGTTANTPYKLILQADLYGGQGGGSSSLVTNKGWHSWYFLDHIYIWHLLSTLLFVFEWIQVFGFRAFSIVTLLSFTHCGQLWHARLCMKKDSGGKAVHAYPFMCFSDSCRLIHRIPLFIPFLFFFPGRMTKIFFPLLLQDQAFLILFYLT